MRYYLVTLGDPSDDVLLDSENARDAYIEALQILGYGIVEREDEDDGNDLEVSA